MSGSSLDANGHAVLGFDAATLALVDWVPALDFSAETQPPTARLAVSGTTLYVVGRIEAAQGQARAGAAAYDLGSRSLLDFARLVEAFDTADTSFVSITQSFNTTTSMGRLTLNMLLSFAQFEREVTAERIRDKIAASKAKGMWMGGIPPLGYTPNGRTLAIVEEHAAVTRHIFRRYLELRNVRRLAEELVATGHTAPARLTASGRTIGGRPFSRGQLYLMLKCVTYTGQILHHGTIYAGRHPAIIDADTFARVQAILADNPNATRARPRASNPSPLARRSPDAGRKPPVPVHCK